jgi:hypothetical protein
MTKLPSVTTYHYIKTSLLLLSIVAISCFNVREPGQPTGESGFISPTAPEILINNFSDAYVQLNAENFTRCFNENRFQFIPEPEVIGSVNVFQNWTLRKEERDVIINIRNRTMQGNMNRLRFDNPRLNYLTPDSLECTTNYSLQLFTTDTLFSTTELQGTARFIMVRNTSRNEWFINLWQDNKIGTAQCWTQLKQRFVAP